MDQMIDKDYYIVFEEDVKKLPAQYLKHNTAHIKIVEEDRVIEGEEKTFMVYVKVDFVPEYGFSVLHSLSNEDLTHLKLLNINVKRQTVKFFIKAMHNAILYGKSDLWKIGIRIID